MTKPPKTSQINSLYADSLLGSELQQLISENERLFKKNQEFRDILRKAVLAVEGEQIYSFSWKEWSEMAKKAIR